MQGPDDCLSVQFNLQERSVRNLQQYDNRMIYDEKQRRNLRILIQCCAAKRMNHSFQFVTDTYFSAFPVRRRTWIKYLQQVRFIGCFVLGASTQ